MRQGGMPGSFTWLHQRLVERRDAQAAGRPADADLELRRRLAELHVGDLANLLETLAPDLRALACGLVDSSSLAAAINDMAESAADALVADLPDDLLIAGLATATDVEDVEGVLRCLPPKRRSRLMQDSGLAHDEALRKSLSFAPGTVGELMSTDHTAVAGNLTVSECVARLRAGHDLPPHTDKLFITAGDRLVGVLPLKRMLLNPPEAALRDIMVSERLHCLTPDFGIERAVEMFERYDLISAPVLNATGDLLGRLTVDELIYHLQDARHAELLTSSGVRDEEDLYATTWQRMRNRGLWVFINLVAAFLVSRVIGVFEDMIIQLVALASLMPIIASMAGNTGMQTATMIIRAMALGQFQPHTWPGLLGREVLLGTANGLLWGTLVGMFGFFIYRDVHLALVLTVSMALVFVLGALVGFLVPVAVNRLRKDPALGAAVIVTTTTDCLGFFIFLGLASLLLA